MADFMITVIMLVGVFVVWLALDSLVLDIRDILSKKKNQIYLLFFSGMVLYVAGTLAKTGKFKSNIPANSLMNLGAILLVLAVVWAIFRLILRKTTKKRALEIEEARREYFRRTRKGVTIEEAEKKALNFLKKRVKDGKLRIYKSLREIKTWYVYLEGKNRRYKVVIDNDGEIADWTTFSPEESDDPFA